MLQTARPGTFIGRGGALLLWALCSAPGHAGVATPSGPLGPPAPLTDPLPERIAPSPLTLNAAKFVRLPKTQDTLAASVEVNGVSIPLGITFVRARVQSMQPIPDGSGRLLISDLRGVIYVTDASGSAPRVYLDVRTRAEFGDHVFPNEAGLLGFAVHPDFGKPDAAGYGKLYTAYSAHKESGTPDFLADAATSHHSVVREWTATNAKADSFAGSSREVLRVGQFAQNHNVGTLAFNLAANPDTPDYGKLYICFGDGGGAYDARQHGQNRATPLAAILRIDPLVATAGRGYNIPSDNPFFKTPGALDEIWAYGLRHPQHFSFDRRGRLFINDIGQDQVEEVNLGVAGGNYGWRVREGTFATAHAYPGARVGPVYPAAAGTSTGFVEPIAQYDHDEGNAAGSGFLYEGSTIPALVGQYVLADIVTGALFHFDATAPVPGELARLYRLNLLIDGESGDLATIAGTANTYAPNTRRADLRLARDAAGELYLLTKGDGWVRKLTVAEH